MPDIDAPSPAGPDAPALAGMHHVSALSAHIGQSRDFYVAVLGLRPVITTVNQDDPGMYHLFFSDGAGSPGSEMTVFDLPGAVRERRGHSSITRTSFRVSGDAALEFWRARLDAHGVAHGGVRLRDGRRALDFDDPEGTRLALVDDAGAGEAVPWAASPVPAEHQLRGLGYVTLAVPDPGPTHRFLTEALGLRLDHHYAETDAPDAPDASDATDTFDVRVYVAGGGGVHAELHVAVRPALARARYGAGGVHHLALRVGDAGRLEAWRSRLDALDYRNSGIVDRHYFTSLYVREPNHVLFELATDGPGFAVDGPLDPDALSLPPALEPRRAEIEARLKPLR